MNDFDPNQLLDRGETAAMLTRLGFKISKQTLAKLACMGADAPEYRLAFGRALYRAGEARAWAERRLSMSRPRRASFEADTAAA
jgi:hypothetical protein